MCFKTRRLDTKLPRLKGRRGFFVDPFIRMLIGPYSDKAFIYRSIGTKTNGDAVQKFGVWRDSIIDKKVLRNKWYPEGLAFFVFINIAQ